MSTQVDTSAAKQGLDTPPRRIGLILPSHNIAFERDFHAVSPPSVTVQTARLRGGARTSPQDSNWRERLSSMNRNLPAAVEALADANVDVLVYGCTNGSFAGGADSSSQIANQIEAILNRPTVITTASLISAMKRLNIVTPAVLTPYAEPVNVSLEQLLRVSGFVPEYVVGDPSGQYRPNGVLEETPSQIVEFALGQRLEGADSVILACTGWRALEAALEIERRARLPVVTSNQATIWAALHVLGLRSQHPVFRRLNAAN